VPFRVDPPRDCEIVEDRIDLVAGVRMVSEHLAQVGDADSDMPRFVSSDVALSFRQSGEVPISLVLARSQILRRSRGNAFAENVVGNDGLDVVLFGPARGQVADLVVERFIERVCDRVTVFRRPSGGSLRTHP